jgi:nucleoside-diphosphate-sugar epimerase
LCGGAAGRSGDTAGMRIFIAGAMGAIGVPLDRRLVADGHAVAGMTRSESRAGALRAIGGEPVVCDVFDQAALNAAVAGARWAAAGSSSSGSLRR